MGQFQGIRQWSVCRIIYDLLRATHPENNVPIRLLMYSLAVHVRWKLSGMGSRQFCRGRGRGRGREVEEEARQGSNVLNRGEARQRQRARGRGEAD